MAIKKIVAANMRRALEIAREQLGADAIILSTRRHPDGIELMATVEAQGQFPDDQAAFATQKQDEVAPLDSDNAWQHQHLVASALADQTPPAQPSRTALGAQGTVFGGKTGPQLAAEIEAARQRMLAGRQQQPSQPAQAAQAPAAEDVWASQLQQPAKPVSSASAGSGAAAGGQEMARLHAELAEMRQLLHQQLEQGAYGAAAVTNPLAQKLMALGLPGHQAERLVASVDSDLPAAKAWPEALALLSQRLPVSGKDLVAMGGMFAFVGPTGVGKTTTLAKLAVRHVLAHGTEGLALVTTDNFRLAAHEQLTSLGRLLGVPVKVVGEGESLAQVLTHLSHKKLILIDTAGLRHGDPRLKTQLEQLRSAGQVQSLLVLAANSQRQMLKASCHAYGAAAPVGMILTKLDETPSLGEALGMLLQHRLPLIYTTDGQEIPADLHLAKGHQLVAKAAKVASDSPSTGNRNTPLQV